MTTFKFFFKWAAYGLILLLITAGTLIGCHHLVRPGMPEYKAALAPVELRPASDAITVQWFGVTATVISDGQTKLFIDPFFSRPEGWLSLIGNAEITPDRSAISAALTQYELNQLDAVLVSHSHFDHAMDAPAVSALSGATLYGSPSTIQLGLSEALPAAQLQAIEPAMTYPIGQFTVTFLESEHAGLTGGRPTGDIEEPLDYPAQYLDYKQGGTYSILIEHPQGNILHHGSAGYKPDMFKLNGQDVKADVALLGISIRPDLEDYYQNTIDIVNAKRVIPTHWDDFTVKLPANNHELPKAMPFGVNLDEFFAESAQIRPSVEVQSLRIGQKLTLYPSTE